MDQIVEPVVRETKPPPQARPKRRVRAFLIFLLLMGSAGAGVWWLTHRLPATAPQHGRHWEDVRTVGVAEITKGDVPVAYQALGTVTALATVTVRTQIAGQLQSVGFTEGQMVKKGDFLAQIDPRPYEVALAQAEAALAKDQATLRNAQVDLARYQKLAQQDSIARQQVDTQAATVAQAEATIATDSAQIDSARLNLAYCRILAPIDGRVGLRQVDPGNYVQTSDTGGIVVITELEPISVVFTQPEDRLPAIMGRLRAGAKLAVTLTNRTGQQVIGEGQVATVDNQIDTTTGTAKLRAILPNTDLALFPNQFVNVRLLVDTMKDVAVVPTAAIQTGQPGTFVYRLKDDHTVTVAPVRLGPVDGERTAVIAGLAPGDKVVVDGIDRLREGTKVRLPGERQREEDAPDGAGPGEAGKGTAGGDTGKGAAPGETGKGAVPGDSGKGTAAEAPSGGAATGTGDAAKGTAEGDAGGQRKGNRHRRDKAAP